MRQISADYIYLSGDEILKNGVISINDKKIITDIKTSETCINKNNIEFYKGIIVPGFVNSHCHLELSDIQLDKSDIKGVEDFFSKLIKVRIGLSGKNIVCKDAEMYYEGIVAVADIVSTELSFNIKNSSNIYYYNLIELIGADDNIAEKRFMCALKLQEKFSTLPSIISPHATYSVSKLLLKIYNNYIKNKNSTISFHNQESSDENLFFQTKKGKLADFYSSQGINIDNFIPTGQNSLQSFLKFLPKKNNIILVHNIYTSQKDIDKTKIYNDNLFYCLCPQSNLIIEKKLPDIDMFRKNHLKIVVGTDSLASNTKLSILNELKIIKNNFKHILFNEMLNWATINGALALGIDNQYGSIAKGKQPGLVLIDNFDFKNMQITDKSCSKLL